ncbi:MAG: hypothetical protein Kow0080_06080 [Candidatus Promineifilaceae bacterium]
MTAIVTIHAVFSNTIRLYFLLLGLWGLVRAVRGQDVDGSYLGAGALGVILFAVQGVLGVILWINGNMAAVSRPEMHILYGVFPVVFLPFVYANMLKGDTSNRGMWVLTFAVLFTFGVAWRAMAVAG